MTQETPHSTRYSHGCPVFIVDGGRSPFLKFRGKPGPFNAADLAVYSARPLLLRQPFETSEFDEVILGCVNPGPDEVNIARIVALRLGCGDQMPAWTVQRNCASGLQALDCAFRNIASGRADLILAGGVDAMSHAPLLVNNTMVNWLADWNRSRGLGSRLKMLGRLRPGHFAPVVGLIRGLTDPIVGLSMGQTAENLAYQFGITRNQMDAYAIESHKRLSQAQESGHLDEIEVLYDHHGNVYNRDDGVRPESTVEKLATLEPVFDKVFGNVTAGNSAQVTDGAAWLILASEDAVDKHNLSALGLIVDTQWSALNPAQMGLGPVHAAVPMLQRRDICAEGIDYWEINEAFAAQVLACLEALTDAEYSRRELRSNQAFGEIPHARLNVDGGGISLGHPVGASGARIVLHLLKVLQRHKAERGVAALCIGGGQGGAMLLENVSG